MRVTLPTGTPVELARAGAPRLGLVVVPDIWGLRPLFDDHAARLARELRAEVAVVEPFPGPALPAELEARVAAMRPDRAIADDLRAAAALVGGAGPVAVLGFCMGGMEALKAAALGCFSLAVSCYGMIRVPPAWRAVDRGEPLDALDQPGRAPVLAVVGGRDPFTPASDVAALAALADVEVVRYPSGEHGFVHDPSRPTHRPADAADVWARVHRAIRSQAVSGCAAPAPSA
ncbi:MAG: dienelactone hydrolase family protein [Acidimicrobiales bacterium]